MFAFGTLAERVEWRLVSRDWCRALDDERNWRAVDFGSMGVAPPRGVPALLKWVVGTHGPHIHDISTRGCYISDESVQEIGKHCLNLEVLIVDEYVPERPDEEAAEWQADAAAAARGVGPLALPEPVTRSPARRLRPNVRDAGIEALAACPHLTRLDASRCHLTDAAAASLAEHHSFLSYLKLGSPELSNVGVEAVAKASRDLLALDVSGSAVDDGALRVIGETCVRLRMLNAEGCERITDEGIGALVEGCQELRILILNGCPLLTNDTLSAIAQQCEMLHRLDISHNPYVTDDGLDELADCCEDLESLNVVRCPGITGDGLTTVLAECPHLRQLHCEGVKLGHIVEELHPHCLSLTNLSLRRCGALSDLAVTALAHGCPNVTALDLAGNPITGFTHLAVGALLGKLRGLRSLDLTGCGLTDESLSFLTCRAPRLIRACFGGNPGVTDVGLEFLLTATGPHLLELSLRDCDITDEGMRSLADTGVNLTRLDLTGCRRLTDEGMDALAQGCVQLEVLLCGGGYPGTGSAAVAAVAAALDLPRAGDAASSPAGSRGGGGGAAGLAAAVGLDDGGDGEEGSGSGKKKRKKRKKKKKKGSEGGEGDGEDGGEEGGGPAVSAPLPTPSTGGTADESRGRAGDAAGEDGTAEGAGGSRSRKSKRKRRGGKGKAKGRPNAMQLGDGTLEAVTRHCPRLHSLHMPGCPAVTDRGLRTLAEAAGALRLVSLYFGGCDSITEAGVLDLLDGCSRLGLISLPQCAGLPEESLRRILERGREHNPAFVLDPDVV